MSHWSFHANMVPNLNSTTSVYIRLYYLLNWHLAFKSIWQPKSPFINLVETYLLFYIKPRQNQRLTKQSRLCLQKVKVLYKVTFLILNIPSIVKYFATLDPVTGLSQRFIELLYCPAHISHTIAPHKPTGSTHTPWFIVTFYNKRIHFIFHIYWAIV